MKDFFRAARKIAPLGIDRSISSGGNTSNLLFCSFCVFSTLVFKVKQRIILAEIQIELILVPCNTSNSFAIALAFSPFHIFFGSHLVTNITI